MSLSGTERATWWLKRTHGFDVLRYNILRQAHPEASEPELMALWTEETYRGKVDPGFLARACEAIREREEG